MWNQSWPSILICLFVLLTLLGCGRSIVDPGRSTAIISPPTALPVTPTESMPLTPVNSNDVEQVPTESVLRLPKESDAATYHSVQSGETLATIAKKYGIGVEQLRKSNGLDAASSLKPQQLLFIPRSQ